MTEKDKDGWREKEKDKQRQEGEGGDKSLEQDSPVSTALAEGSARSRADLPSVLRMPGSAPCWSSTVQGKHKQYLSSGRHRLALTPPLTLALTPPLTALTPPLTALTPLAPPPPPPVPLAASALPGMAPTRTHIARGGRGEGEKGCRRAERHCRGRIPCH